MSFLIKFSGYGAVLVHIVTGVLAYHFDVNNPISYQDLGRGNENRSSYFGYSLALLNTSSGKSWIFIGAPRANSSLNTTVIETGTVFKCEIGEPSQHGCQEWIIKTRQASPEPHSWIGGSIKIGKDNNKDIVLVCAPRWLNTHRWSHFWIMSGMCYQRLASSNSKSTSKVDKALQPLKSIAPVVNGDLYYAMGEAGFSIHIIPDSHSLKYILGCPGAYLSHGTPIFYRKERSGQTSFITPKVYEDPSVLDMAYSGYAVTSGFYFDKSKRMNATGAPRGANLYGKVIVFDLMKMNKYNDSYDWFIQEKTHVNGTQIGEYFGSALASCDINGDGRDDLLVGAPQWSKESDEGRIYIFTAKNSMHFDDGQHIDGKTIQGRFGSTITCLGDIDYDGFDDVAVGAPYDGNGAVYIYHGGKDELRLTQKISGPADTKGFGISISEPRDIDNNGYGDIAVGAYISGHVTVFRSKRVVSMTITMSELSRGPVGHDPDRFSVKVCSSYKGRYAPDKLDVTTELRLDKIHRGAEFDTDSLNKKIYKINHTIMKFNTSCHNLTIIIMEEDEDVISPITISAIQRLDPNNKNWTLLMNENDTTNNNYFYNFSAVMNEAYQKARFVLGCGEDNICNSNLSVHMMTNLEDNNRYVIGSMSYINVTIEVTNTGELVYGAKAVLLIPDFIDLIFIPLSCTKVKKSTRVECDISNPLNRNDTKNVTLQLDMSKVTGNIEQFYLHATAMTQNSNDKPSGEHEKSLLINCVAETDIGIAGKANKDFYRYAPKDETVQLLPIMFQHIYQIRNYESTPISEALLSVSIPTHWILDGNEIEVVKVNTTIGELDQREFHCRDVEENDPQTMNSHNSLLKFVPQADANLTTVEGKTFDASLDNRTLHINCTNPSFKWKTINCKLGPFNTAKSVAQLVITFDLLLPNFTPGIIDEKDIILFVTNASTKLTMPFGITQTINNKPDSILIGTMFVGSPSKYKLPSWLIPLSVSGGLLLLTIVILGLFKFGFFKRSKKMELEALMKEEKNRAPKVVLETNSSTEALDAYFIR